MARLTSMLACQLLLDRPLFATTSATRSGCRQLCWKAMPDLGCKQAVSRTSASIGVVPTAAPRVNEKGLML